MITEELLARAKKHKQPKCPARMKWIKSRHIHKKKYYLATNEIKCSYLLITWIILAGNMLMKRGESKDHILGLGI